MDVHCLDCKAPNATIKLKCNCEAHFICGKCISSRIESNPADQAGSVLVCMVCSGAAVSGEKGVWIYVDDSNIWIEAKKLAGKKKGFKTKEDHRVRIEIGKLTDVVASGRPVAQGFLYGSEPPAIDSVWEKIKQKGWRVDKKKKSYGKEKMVDTQLVADVTEKACTTPEEERTTIIFITGDADAMPAISKVLSYRGWKVEICMWEHSMSSQLKKLTKENENVKVSYLNEYLSKVTFTNMKFSKDGHLFPQVKSSGVVITMKRGAFRNQVPTKAWCDELDSIAQWPFQYYWIENGSNHPTESDDLVVVFNKDFDITQLLESLDEHPVPHMQKAQPALQYFQARSGLYQYAFSAVGRFSWEDFCEGSGSETLYVDSEGSDPWRLARHESKVRQRSQKYSDPCPFKFNCRFGMACFNKHTDEEKAFFHTNMGKGNPVRKVKPCRFYPNCKKPKVECIYAHGDEDAWCLMCQEQAGHFTENCQHRALL